VVEEERGYWEQSKRVPINGRTKSNPNKRKQDQTKEGKVTARLKSFFPWDLLKGASKEVDLRHKGIEEGTEGGKKKVALFRRGCRGIKVVQRRGNDFCSCRERRTLRKRRFRLVATVQRGTVRATMKATLRGGGPTTYRKKKDFTNLFYGGGKKKRGMHETCRSERGD